MTGVIPPGHPPVSRISLTVTADENQEKIPWPTLTGW
jgi:hypothetical protein